MNITMENDSQVQGLDEYNSDADLASVSLFKDYPDPLLTFASVCCVIYMIIGIPGNLITIIALARCKKVRNATAIFIMNLSFSDLLFCCFNIPLAASTFWMRSWPHGKLLCRMFPMARYGLVAVSLFTVLAITINRYIMVLHPILYSKIYKNRYISVMIALIWTTSFGSMTAVYFEVWGRFSLHKTTGSCTIVSDENGTNPKRLIFIIAFALPTLAIILCYARILRIVRKTSKKSQSLKPVRKPHIEIEPTITEVPETDIPSISDEVVQRRENKCQMKLPCFLSPELSSSSNDSSSQDKEDMRAPEFRPSALTSERAQRIRQSFVATFRKSTAMIKPRMPTKKDKRLLTMIVAIITSFLVCHLPITLTKTIFSELTSHPGANIAGYLLIYATTCINPIIYVVMSIEYRQAYKNLFKSVINIFRTKQMQVSSRKNLCDV